MSSDNKESPPKNSDNNNNNNSENNTKEANIKELPTYEYFQRTVQKEIQQGLLNVSKLKPADPIKYLGEYLLEKSKSQ